MRTLVAAACVVVLLASPLPTLAQEILLTGPLAGARVGRTLWRARRIELAATSGVRAVSGVEPGALLAGELRYYPLDRLGVGAWAGGALPLGGGCSRSCFMVAIPELALVPLVGKSSWLGYVRYDVHLLAGPAWTGPTTGDDGGRHFAASVGGGFRAFLASHFSTSLGYRALVGDDIAHLVTLSVSHWPTRRRWDDE